MENTLLSISGQTAIGKTRWAIRLARRYQTEILSFDSRQFYREMPIGTAQPSAEELRQAPHHFIGHLSVQDHYSVGDYRQDALEKLKALFKTQPLVIMVGGSGLYLEAVTKGLDEFPDIPPAVRSDLQQTLQAKGIRALQDLLREKDPVYYEKVDLKNPRRLLRALEVSLVAGKPYSSFRGKRNPPGFFRHLPLGIQAPREVVYSRIGERVNRMMAEGLLEEARALYPMRRLPALQTVGYQELFAYMEGRWDLETAVEEIKKNTRRFAKRQGTWLRKQPGITWIGYEEDANEAFERIDEKLKRLP